MLSYFSNEFVLSPFSSLNVGRRMLISAESHGFSPSNHQHLAVVSRKYQLLCSFHTVNQEHCLSPRTVITQPGFDLSFGGVSAHPFSMECGMIPPLIQAFHLTRVYLEQCVLTANPFLFLNYQSPGKIAFFQNYVQVFMYCIFLS